MSGPFLNHGIHPPYYVSRKLELRAITNSDLNRESAVMMSSTTLFRISAHVLGTAEQRWKACLAAVELSFRLCSVAFRLQDRDDLRHRAAPVDQYS